MASKAAQKGLKYEPVEKIPDGGAEQRGCNFWTSLSPDFRWADDFLHSRLAQIGRLDCLSPERHALEIGRRSCGNAFSSPTRVSGCGNAGSVYLLIVHHHWAAHAHQCHIAIWRAERRHPSKPSGRPRSATGDSIYTRGLDPRVHRWRQNIARCQVVCKSGTINLAKCRDRKGVEFNMKANPTERESETLEYGANTMSCVIRCLPHIIRERAYQLFDARGGQPGHELDDWLQAEREIKHYF